MSKTVGLDLSKFKHVSSDDKTTTLKHYEGHTITLAHGKLSKGHREALKAMGEKAAAKASKQSEETIQLAEGGEVEKKKKVMTAIKAPNAAKGVDLANRTRKEGDASPNGITIQVPGKEESNNYGKVTGPDGEKPQVFAEGGQVQYLAEGDMVQPIPEMLAMDPNAQPTLPPTVEASPMAPPMNFGLPDLTDNGIDMAIQPSSPEAKYDFYKKHYPYMSEEGALKAVQGKEAEKYAGMQGRMMDSAKQAGTTYSTLNQKQAMGIPLTPEEQQQLGQLNSQVEAQAPQPGALQAAQTLTQGTTPKSQAAGIPGAMNDMEGTMGQGYSNQMAGINAQANAQGALGQQQAEILQRQEHAQAVAKQTYEDTFAGLEEERQALMQDVKDGHVDPNKYWTGDKDGNGGHSKVMAGIGMILAGFNPTSAPNAAMSFLKTQMEMNLQAQTKNLDSKQNLLSANLRQFGNLKDATEMTRIMQMDMVATQLQEAAAKAQSPMAKAAALTAAGQLQMQSAPMFQQFAMRRAMMNLNSSGAAGQSPEAVEQMLGYMRVANPEMAKDIQARFVPGVGLGTIPIPDPVRTEITGKQTFDKAAQHYVDWVKQNANSLNPAKINQGATMAAELQGMYRMATKGGVYKEGEQEFIEKLIPSDPAQFVSSIRTLPKIQELVHSNNMQLNQLKKGYGLPEAPGSSQPQYKVVNGVKYMRDANGKAVPAK